jgi:hypothetical protein
MKKKTAARGRKGTAHNRKGAESSNLYSWDTYGGRFRWALHDRGVQVQFLADQCSRALGRKVAKSTLSEIKQGRSKSSQYNSLIARFLNLDDIWLATGKGQAPTSQSGISEDGNAARRMLEATESLTDDELDLLASYRVASQDGKSLIRTQADQVSKLKVKSGRRP